MSPDLIAVLVVGVLYGLDRFGVLPKAKSSSDAAAELLIANERADRLQGLLEQSQARERELSRTRSMEPVLELVRSVFETQQTTLEKLAQFNGALKRNEEGLLGATEALNVTSEGLKALTSTIAELHDLPMRPPEQSRPRVSRKRTP